MLKIVLTGVFATLAVYLFATAPEKLPDQAAAGIGRCNFKVTSLFDGANTINETARTIYTKRIVGGGGKAGLKFGEDWQEPGVEKGPLPALFLRLTAARLETKPPRLGLYLGSDAPINKSNLFTPEQLISFEEVKASRAPVFQASAVAGNVAMYPDVAGVAPCVDCHNEHLDSPKTNWALDDVMGATTWTYPDAQLSSDDYVTAIEAVFTSVGEAYQQYLDKTAVFSEPVPQTRAWPEKGAWVLPTRETFMTEVRTAAAPALIDAILPAAGSGQDGANPCVF
ncbi:MAG: hypothetical protein ACU0A6_07560 [Shimia sp.]|uniref:hypothetical protein n=1 Tax=Shimia sp. TaxID=1954381 RepID=UPI004059FAB2